MPRTLQKTSVLGLATAALVAGMWSAPASAAPTPVVPEKTAVEPCADDGEGTLAPQEAVAGGERVALSKTQLSEINSKLQAQGQQPLPEGTAVLEVTDEAKVRILDTHGNPLTWEPRATTASSEQLVTTASVGDEIKRVVGACLGIDFAANVGAWEAIESQVNSWDKAAKFVLRRVGVIAILSCGGGVFAEYVL